MQCVVLIEFLRLFSFGTLVRTVVSRVPNKHR